MLRNDLFERQQRRNNAGISLLNSIQRFTCRHIMILKELFKQSGRQRDIKTLETMLKHLSYLKKQDKELRKQIYRKAELIKFPSQHTIF
jgi:uncharacterized membrane protein YgaE (UPF0421/DUF939 family)